MRRGGCALEHDLMDSPNTGDAKSNAGRGSHLKEPTSSGAGSSIRHSEVVGLLKDPEKAGDIGSLWTKRDRGRGVTLVEKEMLDLLQEHKVVASCRTTKLMTFCALGSEEQLKSAL